MFLGTTNMWVNFFPNAPPVGTGLAQLENKENFSQQVDFSVHTKVT